MNSDDLARQLHVRAARGEKLSAEEKSLLNEWYARQDTMESSLTGQEPSFQKDATVSQDQVTGAMNQLVVLTQRIQQLSEENESLRREIAALQRQVVQKRATQTV